MQFSLTKNEFHLLLIRLSSVSLTVEAVQYLLTYLSGNVLVSATHTHTHNKDNINAWYLVCNFFRIVMN